MRDDSVSSVFAYLDSRGHVRVRAAADDDRALTAEWMMEVGAGESTRSFYRWPTWHRDGTRLVAVGLLVDGNRVTSEIVWCLPLEGTTADGIVDLPDSSLIYAQWSGSGDRLGLLLQDTQGIFLAAVEGHAGAERIPIARGAPLFVAPTASGFVAHVRAESEAARLALPGRRGFDRPGFFRVPWALGDGRVVCTERRAERKHVLGIVEGESFTEIAPLGGRVALVPLDAERALVAAATEIDGSSYAYASVLDVARGSLERCLEREFVALFPATNGRVILVSGDAETALVWSSFDLGSGDEQPLARFAPSASELMRIGFFDQYVLSHAPVSADGATLVLAGHPPGDDQQQSGIYLVATDGSKPAERIADGSFAAFAR